MALGIAQQSQSSDNPSPIVEVVVYLLLQEPYRMGIKIWNNML
jgi:hypothetical protein